MPAGSPRKVVTATFAEVAVRVKCAGDNEAMSFGYGVAGVTDAASAATAADLSWDAFNDEVLPSLSSEYTFLGVQVRTSPAGGNLFAEIQSQTVGTGGVDVLPPNTSALVRKVSGLGGKQNRGRMFIPGIIADTEVGANGLILAGDIGAKTTVINDWFTALQASTHDVVLFHSDYIHDPGDPVGTTNLVNPTTTPTPVTAFQLDTKVATQRRRLR